MRVIFSVLGMTFQAEVTYDPGFTGTLMEPPEPEEVEIAHLSVHGSDALFLMDSVLSEEIEEAALSATKAALIAANDDSAADLYANRQEELALGFR